MYRKLFVEHPLAVKETYLEHFSVAAGFGISMIAGGIGCMIHAVIPGFCKSTGSDTVRLLNERIRVRAQAANQDAPVVSEWVI